MLISDVSKKFGLTADTLRYYEKIHLMNNVNKDNSGRRDYQESDLRRIYYIKCMRTAGLSIENIKLYVDLFNKGENTINDRKQILLDQKELLQLKMDELKSVMSYLNSKIENYDKTLKNKVI